MSKGEHHPSSHFIIKHLQKLSIHAYMPLVGGGFNSAPCLMSHVIVHNNNNKSCACECTKPKRTDRGGSCRQSSVRK